MTTDTAYTYRVTAINASGNSAPSNGVNVTTLLVAPSGLSATSTTATAVHLAWTDITDATTYLIERSTDQVNWTALTPSSPLTQSSAAFSDTTVSAGTNYSYRISAVDAAGKSAASSSVTVLTKPDVPTLTAVPQLDTEIDLSWNPVATATSYLLESSADGGTTWAALATQAGTTFANTGLTADTGYEYRVTAINASGSSATSSAITSTTLVGAPTHFSATAASDTEVDLSWTAVADATTYQVEQSTDGQAWNVLVPATPLTGSSTSFSDTSVSPGTSYQYRIEAINAAGCLSAQHGHYHHYPPGRSDRFDSQCRIGNPDQSCLDPRHGFGPDGIHSAELHQRQHLEQR